MALDTSLAGKLHTENIDNAKIVFQVKSGGVQRGDIAKLQGGYDP